MRRKREKPHFRAIKILLIASLLIASFPLYSTEESFADTQGGFRIALTFDDGYNIDWRIVDYLSSRNIPATAFVIGTWVEQNKEKVAEMSRRGWDICNHTNTHPWLTKIPSELIVAEMRACQEAIFAACGQNNHFMRPPYGAIDARVKQVLSSMGYEVVMWTADSSDSNLRYSPDMRFNASVQGARDGSIILFHFGGQGTFDLVVRVVDYLAAKGARFVTVSELYGVSKYLSGGSFDIGQTNVSNEWIFPEGGSNEGLEEWMMIKNPSSETSSLCIESLTEEGRSLLWEGDIEPNSRITINIRDIEMSRGCSGLRVTSSEAVYAQRSIYVLRPDLANGGTISSGIDRASRTWYFADGRSGGDFSDWLCIVNPSLKDSDISIDFALEAEESRTFDLTVPAGSRRTLRIEDILEIEQNYSMTIEATSEIACERTSYFNYSGWISGMSCSTGHKSPSCRMFFTEGSTRQGFEEWISLYNPTETKTLVSIEYLSSDENASEWIEMPAKSLSRLRLSDRVGAEADCSVRVLSPVPIVADRAVFFNAMNSTGGEVSSALRSPEKKWVFAEGNGGAGFSSWLSLYNPAGGIIDVSIEIGGEAGEQTASLSIVLPSHERLSLLLDEHLPESAYTMVVHSQDEFYCERAVYFNTKVH